MQNYAENTETALKGGVDAVMKSVGAVAKSTQTIGIEWADYAKKSYEASSAAAEKLVAARSLGKVAEIQTAYMKGSYERGLAQATTLRDLYVAMAKDAAKPFEGLRTGLPKFA